MATLPGGTEVGNFCKAEEYNCKFGGENGGNVGEAG